MLSANGGRVAFSSTASSLVPGDTNGHKDVFVVDRVGGRVIRASIAGNGGEADNGSDTPSISGDGSRVAFTSSASNLVPGDDNTVSDVFLRALSPVAGVINATENPTGHNPSENYWCTQGQTGYPVNTASGNFWHTFDDLTVPGRGMNLAFSRTYNSVFADRPSPIGFGWTSNYFMCLSTDPTTGVATIHQEDGSEVSFEPSDGSYRAPPRVLATLVRNDDGSSTFTRRAREIYTFDSAGRLTAQADLNGETTALSYDGAGNVVTISDPAGRSLHLSYDDAGNLSAIADPATPARGPLRV